jgi:hypothetical protein
MREFIDFSSKIDVVINGAPCKKHQASIGVACWGVPTDEGTQMGAVCNTRANKIYKGRIDPRSVRAFGAPKKGK